MSDFIETQPVTDKDWQAVIEKLTAKYRKEQGKIKAEDFMLEHQDIAYLLGMLDKTTSYSLWASATVDTWLEIETEVKIAASKANVEFETALDKARNDENRVNKLVTGGRSWAERESAYRMNNNSLYRANDSAQLAVELVKVISLSMRQKERYLRNLRDDIALRVKMMQLQANLNFSPIYD